MVMKLDTFSSNINIVINEIISDQLICKYLYYNDYQPLLQSDINIASTPLVDQNVFPYPFNPSINEKDVIQLRVYYPRGKFEANYEIITNANLCFDIIIPVSLYLVKDENGNAKIRPYEIAKHVINHFSRNSIGTLGIIHFKEFFHLNVNDKYDCFRLTSETMSYGG